jgi:hypothetical protein
VPLSYTGIVAGSAPLASQLKQVLDCLTGVMTDQPVYVANTIRASSTGAATAAYFAGGTASGHPTTGTHNVGEYTLDLTGSFWICTTTGTPGVWVQAGSVDTTSGDYTYLVAAGASAVAGAVGKAADAAHQHPALVNPAGGFTGNLILLQLAGVDKFKVDQTGLMTNAGGHVMSGPLSGATTITASGDIQSSGGRVIVGALPGSHPAVLGDIIANRGGVTPGSGAIYFGSSAGLHYIYYDGVEFAFSNGIVLGSGGQLLEPFWNGSGWLGGAQPVAIAYGSQCRHLYTNSAINPNPLDGDIYFAA